MGHGSRGSWVSSLMGQMGHGHKMWPILSSGIDRLGIIGGDCNVKSHSLSVCHLWCSTVLDFVIYATLRITFESSTDANHSDFSASSDLFAQMLHQQIRRNWVADALPLQRRQTQVHVIAGMDHTAYFRSHAQFCVQYLCLSISVTKVCVARLQAIFMFHNRLMYNWWPST